MTADVKDDLNPHRKLPVVFFDFVAVMYGAVHYSSVVHIHEHSEILVLCHVT